MLRVTDSQRERSRGSTADDWLIGLGIVLPLIAAVWWYVSGTGSDRATAGPIVVAVVGAAMVLFGVILYAGRRR